MKIFIKKKSRKRPTSQTMKSKLENKTNKSPNEQAGKLGASKLVPAKSDNPINGNWWRDFRICGRSYWPGPEKKSRRGGKKPLANQRRKRGRHNSGAQQSPCQSSHLLLLQAALWPFSSPLSFPLPFSLFSTYRVASGGSILLCVCACICEHGRTK